MLSDSIIEVMPPLILRYLNNYVKELPEQLVSIIQNSCVQLMDSKMIIEDSYKKTEETLAGPKITKELPEFPNQPLIEDYLAMIRLNGFSQYFHQFTAELGRLMIALCGNENQNALLRNWGQKYYKGVFLLTDNGGPSVNNWHSKIISKSDDSIELTLNKIWSIEAHAADYAIVNVKKDNLVYPLSFLIPPEEYKNLDRNAIGLPFLEEKLQLGNVSGNVKICPDMQLSKGGLAGVNQFLAMARPRFVLAVLAHVQWLIDQDRIRAKEPIEKTIHAIESFSNSLLNKTVFDIHSINEVLALKFICNEFIVYLVCSGSVRNIMDQRDLLALSKMEGSSYRCLYEIYARDNRTR